VDTITASVAGILIGVAATTMAFVIVRRRAAAGLDGGLRRRIDTRIGEIRGDRPVIPETVMVPMPLRAPTVAETQRRRLGRDTSAVLVTLGIVLVLGLALVDITRPQGGVLEATATARPSIPAAVPTASAAAAFPDATDVTGPVPGASGSPRPATASPTPSTAGATGPPAATALPLASATAPGASAAPAPSPSSDRYAVLTACQDRLGCYLYTVRRGDNLASIANWFGIPYSTVLELNPQIVDPRRVYAGDRIELPPPRR
jgi:hypothetical protein